MELKVRLCRAGAASSGRRRRAGGAVGQGQGGFTIDEIVDRLARRAAGDAAALDPVWAPESVSWRSYDGRETTMTAGQRRALARTEIESLADAMPDFRRESSFHSSPSTDAIIEFSTWSGTRGEAAVRVEICLAYRVRDGRIERLDMYADAGQFKVLGDVLAASRAA
jgi:ketosteroid isomerase-like protein